MSLFKGFNQFINWMPQPRPDGKIDKIPVGVDGTTVNPLNPDNWKSEEDARKVADMSGYGVGFVFTEEDPFFFVDIDNAAVNGGWSTLANTIVEAFPGCAVEVSQSGIGLHIFGTGKVGPHGCKNTSLNLEFYTKQRFVALTGNGLRGDTAMDGTSSLGWLVENFFPVGNTTVGDWTSEPCEEWNGERDDDKLIQKAIRTKSVAAIFEGRTGFKELWNGEPNGDQSVADSALATHLAYWTGKNCERIERIFNRSVPGGRDKWIEREDYRRRTILAAVAVCSSVHKRFDPIGEGETELTVRVGVQILDLHAQIAHFKDCVYVIQRHRVFSRKYGLLKPDQFRAVYGGYDFAVRLEGRTRNAFEAFTETQLTDFPQVYGTRFRPGKGLIVKEEGLKYVNTYVAPNVESRKGDVTPFTGLLARLLPDDHDRKILLSYMAACVQYPGIKFQWAPLLQGTEGNGKTFLATAVTKAVGEKYSHFPNASDLSSKFTGWLDEKLFICIEELFTSGKTELQEALKPLITNPRVEIQHKGSDQFTGDNRANFFLCSNHRDAVLKTRSDRRYCIFYTAQQEAEHLRRDGMAGNYFPELYKWARGGGWAYITDFFRKYKIEDKFNPAGECHRAPDTSSTPEVLALSLGPVEQEIVEAVGEERVGFRKDWISSIAIDLLLKEKNRKVALNKRRELLKNLGYEVKGRMNSPSPLDGRCKPVLYYRSNREDIRALAPGKDTEEAYLKAQGIK